MVYTLKITPQINQAQIRYYQKSFYSTIHLLGDGGVQPTRQPIKTDPIQPNPPIPKNQHNPVGSVLAN